MAVLISIYRTSNLRIDLLHTRRINIPISKTPTESILSWAGIIIGESNLLLDQDRLGLTYNQVTILERGLTWRSQVGWGAIMAQVVKLAI